MKTEFLESALLLSIFFGMVFGIILISPIFADTEFPSPLKQLRSGIPLDKIQCDDDKTLIALTATKVACVFDSTAEKKNFSIIEKNPDLLHCTMNWDPVCGVDGKTYGNMCMLEVDEIKLNYHGQCIYDNMPTGSDDATSTRINIEDKSENQTVAVMISTGGDFSSHANENIVAIQMAVEDFNDNVKKDWNLKAVLFDSGDVSENIRKIHADGINIVIGPDTSAELVQIKEFVDSNKMLVVSPASTAPSLAVKDSIYRMVPDDTNQGRALASLLEHQYIKSAILLVRDDTWGNDLAKNITDSFESKNGQVVDQIIYDPANPDFSNTTMMLSDSVTNHLKSHKTAQLAVIVLGFGESTDFLREATNHDVLDDVRWYGTDPITKEEKILADPVASGFVQKINFKSLLFAVEPNPLYNEVQVRLYEKLGHLPSAYAYSSYDALWIAGLAMLEAEGADSVNLKFSDVAQRHHGVLGSTELNESGDLVTANYDIWSVGYGKWFKVGNYNQATDDITWNMKN